MVIRLFVGMIVEMVGTIISITAHILGSVVEFIYKSVECIVAKFKAHKKGKGGQY